MLSTSAKLINFSGATACGTRQNLKQQAGSVQHWNRSNKHVKTEKHSMLNVVSVDAHLPHQPDTRKVF